jgi:hypothetical protein
MTSFTTHGESIPKGMLDELMATSFIDSDKATLQQNLAQDGYLYLPGVLDTDAVLDARKAIFSQMASVGEIDDPPMEGISTGTSRRGELVKNLGAYWKDLSEHETLRQVTHGKRMYTVLSQVLGGEVKPFDFLWLRATHPGRASAFHFDHVYMNRGTDNLLTVWTPLGDVVMDEGPITLVEGSHRWDDIIDEFKGFDVDKDTSHPGHVTTTPVALAQERNAHLLTTTFRTGDILIMQMFMLHGSLDNRSAHHRVRLSCDVRYQLARDAFDERWMGENPVGHGHGYASMSGAKPATSNPLFR